jgi:hypothetical protein
MVDRPPRQQWIEEKHLTHSLPAGSAHSAEYQDSQPFREDVEELLATAVVGRDAIFGSDGSLAKSTDVLSIVTQRLNSMLG